MNCPIFLFKLLVDGNAANKLNNEEDKRQAGERLQAEFDFVLQFERDVP